MLITLLSLSIFALALVLLNSVSIVTVKNRPSETVDEVVAVLIPMRNEEAHVNGVLRAVAASREISTLRIYVLDDSSTDRTRELVQALMPEIPNLHLLSGKALEAGWMGKPFACHQLSERAIADGADYLIFLDADTRITPSAISASLSAMRGHGWDFISPHPQELAHSPIARLIQPLMQWSWFASVPVRLGIRFRVPSMAIANGQFIIFHADAYTTAGGHGVVKNEVLEDLEIARAMVRSGHTGGVAVASDVARCQMYQNDAELRTGYGKSLWRAFGSPFGAVIAATLLVGTQTLPFLLALAGSLVAWKVYCINALAHLLVAVKTRSNPINTFAHPVAIILLVSLIIDSFRAKSHGKLQWKERVIG